MDNLKSVNEPNTEALSAFPGSINEPAQPEQAAAEVAESAEKPSIHMADPDELEDEIEEAEEEGEFKPVHASHHTRIKKKRK